MANWAQATADRIADATPLLKGRLLLLGVADTPKTTPMYVLASRPAARHVLCLTPGDMRLDFPFGWS